MAPQIYNWTCSICAFDWVVNATGTDAMTRERAAELLKVPECVCPTYGCKDTSCIVYAFGDVGLSARQAWVTFDQAYAIAGSTTGVINPIGMYHFMAIRGVADNMLWLANSALGYRDVYELLGREQFNALGPVQVIYLEQPQPA